MYSSMAIPLCELESLLIMRQTVLRAIRGLDLAHLMLIVMVYGPVEWFAVTELVVVIQTMEVKLW